MFGGALGLSVRIFSAAGMNYLQAITTFDEEFFFLVLLPPIIFDSGYNMQRVCTMTLIPLSRYVCVDHH
jgi:NhaP-type Na+/H+ or K+/H+ antiporter